MDLPEASYRVSVKGIYQDKKWRYMINIKDWFLGMVGGGIEHGENHEQALIREVKEETNLDISSVSNVPEFFTIYKNRKWVYRAIVLYRIDIDDITAFECSQECDEIRFYTVDELKSMDIDHWMWTSGWIDSL